MPGSLFHDEILHEPGDGICRPTNHAGGLEGGISNGEEIRVQAIVKPIPTLLTALRSVDMTTMEPQPASVERSDTCVLPAAGVVGEAMLCLVLADAALEKFGGDSLAELEEHVASTGSLRRRCLARDGHAGEASPDGLRDPSSSSVTPYSTRRPLRSTEIDGARSGRSWTTWSRRCTRHRASDLPRRRSPSPSESLSSICRWARTSPN